MRQLHPNDEEEVAADVAVLLSVALSVVSLLTSGAKVSVIDAMGLSTKPPTSSVNPITNVFAVLLNVKKGFPSFRALLIDIVDLTMINIII